MKVALFIPCYMDQLYPRAALATLKLLRSLNLSVEYPREQTCCGQIHHNSGCAADATALAGHFLDVFGGYDAVVCPSGSCTAMVRKHYAAAREHKNYEHLSTNTFELCEFLHDILKLKEVKARFPFRTGLLSSCHGLRELELERSSELSGTFYSKVRGLLESVEGLELAVPERRDECCGFGGLFALEERALSCRMGRDRIADFERAGVEALTGTDISCLMHLEGLARRDQKQIRVLHIAEILAGVDE